MATIIPINKKVNSERMLKTGEFQTEYFHNDEMTWLISYLRNVKKLDEKDIFIKWVPFYLKNENVTPEYARDQFKSFWISSYKYTMKDKNPEIVIWQEEIDYINSLPIAQWIRQYMFILILHIRTTGNELYDYLPLGDYRKFLSTTNKNPSEMKDTLIKVLRQYDFIKDVEIEEHHDILETFDEYGNPCDVEYDVVIKNNRLQIKSPICKYGGEIGYRYKTILDGLKDLQEIKDTCICSECGKEFVFNNKTIRRSIWLIGVRLRQRLSALMVGKRKRFIRSCSMTRRKRISLNADFTLAVIGISLIQLLRSTAILLRSMVR